MAYPIVSPGVDVTVFNDSFFIPAQATTIPLFFIATRAGKTQANGVTPAAGTLESGVVRTVTSVKQMLELYGSPYFRNDTSGNEYHGDARNEYGLLALYQFLSVGNRAYVVRANVDLADEPREFLSLGAPGLQPGSLSFNGLGNGTLTGIQGVSSQVEPQLITVTFTTSTAFQVVGSVAGQIGEGTVDLAFNYSDTVDFLITSGTTSFSAGDKFMFQLVYEAVPAGGNVGDGRLNGLVVDSEQAVVEVFTITFDTPTTYDVVGTVSGPAGSGIVGAPFDNNRINFTAVQGAINFAAGDEFTVTVVPISIASPLGTTDAQRRNTIVQALLATIGNNFEVESPLYEFNLVACPGYWEEEIVTSLALKVGRIKNEAMIVADTPANYTPDQIAGWAMTSDRVTADSISGNIAYYYPWCLTPNLDGRVVLGAPSGTALRTIAYSDSVSYIWFAPAGVQRGLVSGVTKVGYFTGTAGTATTFVEVNLNEGQRDMLYEYDKNVNPITFFPGRGLLVWGQKTAVGAASALDRINVARLVMYIKRALRKGMLPYVFEPNDQITRDNVKGAADGVLNDILVKRGLTDYATYCDGSNNTADVIDRNELVLDVALKPTKAAEFIYVNIRVVNTGDEI